MPKIPLEEAYSFDDVLLIPNYSDVLPKDVNVSTRLTRNINLNIPIVSAAMDTVTEADAAITMARVGGMGFIHRNMSIQSQAMEVDKVKKSESGMIVDPVTIHPEKKVSEVLSLMEKYRISGVPVTSGDQLVGIVTNRDLRFETMGLSAAVGRAEIPSTAFFTSISTSSILYSPVVSIDTLDRFSTDVDDISLIPISPLTASSIREVTPSSISTGEAPG